MSSTEWLLGAAGLALVLYVTFLAALVLSGRRTDARDLVVFLPQCLHLFRALARDPRLPRRRKLLLVGLALYLASPLDLVPDFVPVVGQLDDALLVALVLRSVVRAAGRELVQEQWRGSQRSLDVLLRVTA